MINLTKYGTITSPFGDREAPTAGASTNHKGLDIVLNKDRVPSVVAGTVSAAGYNSASGNYITIRGKDGYTYTYKHLAEKSSLKAGDEVQEGQTIGSQGSTGISTGKHLHLEVKNADMEYVDPEKVLSTIGESPITFSGSKEKDSKIMDTAKGILSPVLKVVLCIIIFIVAIFFVMKAFDLEIPTKQNLLKKGAEIIGN